MENDDALTIFLYTHVRSVQEARRILGSFVGFTAFPERLLVLSDNQDVLEDMGVRCLRTVLENGFDVLVDVLIYEKQGKLEEDALQFELCEMAKKVAKKGDYNFLAFIAPNVVADPFCFEQIAVCLEHVVEPQRVVPNLVSRERGACTTQEALDYFSVQRLHAVDKRRKIIQAEDAYAYVVEVEE